MYYPGRSMCSGVFLYRKKSHFLFSRRNGNDSLYKDKKQFTEVRSYPIVFFTGNTICGGECMFLFFSEYHLRHFHLGTCFLRSSGCFPLCRGVTSRNRKRVRRMCRFYFPCKVNVALLPLSSALEATHTSNSPGSAVILSVMP